MGAVKKPELTERQQMAVTLRDHDGLTWDAIGEQMDIAPTTAKRTYDTGKEKMSEARAKATVPELPEGSEGALEAFATLGFSPAQSRRGARRHAAGQMHDEPDVPSNDELVHLLKQKTAHIVRYIDDFAMAGAGLKDLTASAGVLIDRAQLISGLPTAIVSREERQNWDKLAPALLAEIERRGLTIPAVKTTYQVESSGIAQGSPDRE